MSDLNQGASIEAASRAEFEAWAMQEHPEAHASLRDDGEYKHGGMRDWWPCWQAARRTPAAATGDGELPPLPWGEDFEAWLEPRRQKDVAAAFHDYARAAIAADRAQRKQAALQEITDIGQEIEQGASRVQTTPLTRCAAGRDGDCNHPQCPQAGDGEPYKTQRHCPLDTLEDEE